MAITVYTITATAPTLVAPADGNRISLFIINRGTARVYLGNDTSVTSAGANGLTLDPGEEYSADGVAAARAKYAIATAGSQRIEVETSP